MFSIFDCIYVFKHVLEFTESIDVFTQLLEYTVRLYLCIYITVGSYWLYLCIHTAVGIYWLYLCIHTAVGSYWLYLCIHTAVGIYWITKYDDLHKKGLPTADTEVNASILADLQQTQDEEFQNLLSALFKKVSKCMLY